MTRAPSTGSLCPRDENAELTGSKHVKRRTRLIIKVTATLVVIASVVLARLISEDGVARFGLGQAALFFTFAIASIALFAVVVTDFDKWVETVPPVPKRALRRLTARRMKWVGDAGGAALALFGAGMTWFWSRVGGGLGWLASRAVARVAWFWTWVARAESAVLVEFGVAMQWVWSTAGRAVVSMLAHVGRGLTVLWVWAVRGAVRALIVYRTGMHRLWSGVGHAFAWTLARSGEGLTVLWVWAVRGGERALVRYRVAMQWLWSNTGRAFRWALIRVGVALRVSWTGFARGAGWTLARCRSGVRLLRVAIVGRGDEPTPKPIRRWYTATVDAAFGIPPAGTNGRRVRRPRRKSRPEAGRSVTHSEPACPSRRDGRRRRTG